MEKIKLEKIKDLNFLCNYENGAVIYVEDQYTKEIKEYLESQDKNKLSDKVLNYLEECEFYETSDEPKGQAYIHVTDRCNMDCIGCYSRTSLRNHRKDMTLDEIKEVLNQFKEHGIHRVVISGGEPMLRQDIAQIVSHGKKLGFEMAMISNGSFLIPSETMRELDYLSFSVDVMSKKQNQLNRVMHKENLLENIKTARATGVYVNGIVTLNAFNVDNLEPYFEMSEEYDFPITFSIFHSTEEESKPFLLKDDQLRRLVDQCVDSLPELIEGFSSFDDIFCRESCGAGKTNLSIDASGNLSPCHMLHNISVGNVLENKDEAWKNLQNFWNQLCTPSECSACEYFAFCGAGCKARALLTGDGKGKDPYCEMYKSYYDKQYVYLKKIIEN